MYNIYIYIHVIFYGYIYSWTGCYLVQYCSNKLYQVNPKYGHVMSCQCHVYTCYQGNPEDSYNPRFRFTSCIIDPIWAPCSLTPPPARTMILASVVADGSAAWLVLVVVPAPLRSIPPSALARRVSRHPNWGALGESQITNVIFTTNGHWPVLVFLINLAKLGAGCVENIFGQGTTKL